MNPSTPGVTPLRQRMLDDMRMRKLEPKTQAGYLRAVRHLAAFARRSGTDVGALESDVERGRERRPALIRFQPPATTRPAALACLI